MSTTTVPPVRPQLALAELGPIAQLRAGRLLRRLPQLYVGLVLYGVSLALMARSDLGLAPWSVMESGLAGHLGITLGQAVIGVSFVVLVLWLPLREMPGLATLSNALIVGLAADATLALLAAPEALPWRIGFVIGGVLLCAVATACYIGAQLGRGPRDGLMTGLHRRTGLSIRLVRTALEVTVVLVGLPLGGALGVGTVLFALAIGPLTQVLMPWFLVDLKHQELFLERPAST